MTQTRGQHRTLNRDSTAYLRRTTRWTWIRRQRVYKWKINRGGPVIATVLRGSRQTLEIEKQREAIIHFRYGSGEYLFAVESNACNCMLANQLAGWI